MTTVIAVALEKGGVGKTTTAVTLAHGLVRRGRSVVLVDLDSQGNTSICLGRKPEPGLYRLLMGAADLAEVLVEARPGLWLLPGNVSTAELKKAIGGRDYADFQLADALADLDAEFVILDTGPGRDVLHANAHQAAGEVVIPVALDMLAMIGVNQEMDTLRTVRKRGHEIALTAILPTFYDSVTTESATNLRALADKYGGLVLPAVPRTTKLREAPAFGQTIWEYLPAGHPALVAYDRLVERVLHE